MNKIKLLTIGVIGLLLLNLVLMGMMYMHRPIGPRPGDRHMKDDGPKQLIIDRLHLSDDQVKQYDILIDQHQASINELDSKIKTAKHDLYATLSDPTYAGADSILQRLNEWHSQIEKLHYDHFKSVREICSEDQMPAYNRLTTELAHLFQPNKNTRLPRD